MTTEKRILRTDEHGVLFLSERLRQCRTLKELRDRWESINPAYHPELADLKDKLKDSLK